MSDKEEKRLPDTAKKQDIKIKNNPTAEALKKAPDEALAKAIHDMLLKEKL